VLDHSVSKLDKICTNTQTLANACTLTHAADCIQSTQQHRSIRSRRRSVSCQRQWRAAPPRGRFVFPNSAIICDSLTVITLTHRTKRTKHALNARHRAAACNANIMRGSPHNAPFPMHSSRSSGLDRTHVQAVPGWRSVLPMRMQTISRLMVVVCPQVIARLPTSPVAAPTGRAFTSTALTFHHCESLSGVCCFVLLLVCVCVALCVLLCFIIIFF